MQRNCYAKNLLLREFLAAALPQHQAYDIGCNVIGRVLPDVSKDAVPLSLGSRSSSSAP